MMDPLHRTDYSGIQPGPGCHSDGWSIWWGMGSELWPQFPGPRLPFKDVLHTNVYRTQGCTAPCQRDAHDVEQRVDREQGSVK